MFGAVGERFGLVYFLQHLLLIGGAGVLALATRRIAGPLAGLSTCALFLLYQPLQFFASRLLAEALAVALLCGAVGLWTLVPRPAAGLATGLLTGLASLARPNVGLVAPLLGASIRQSSWCAALVLAGFAIALVPTTVRNYQRSGHVVPISSNAGLTLYHGNGPDPTGFINMAPELAQSHRGNQRRIATEVASARVGRPLDPVEADRYWAREAVRERLAHPAETVGLMLWRVALLGWNEELSLDLGPRQDPNPLRWLAPLPFAPILGLAAAGVALVGWRGTGGWSVWSVVLACAVGPLVFYVSSRYRLPFAAMLCMPAGVGLAATLRPPAAVTARRRIAGWVALLAVVAGSLAVPGDELLAQGDAAVLVARARAWHLRGSSLRAEADLRRALTRYPGSAPARYELGQLLLAMGREAEAQAAFRQVVTEHPGFAQAGLRARQSAQSRCVVDSGVMRE